MEVQFKKYISEEERRKSFDTWIHYTNPERLIQSGFYFFGGSDTVQCFSCGVRLQQWKVTDIADVEHLKHSPMCQYMKQRSSLNISLYMDLTLALIQDNKELKEKMKTLERRGVSSIWGYDEVDHSSVRGSEVGVVCAVIQPTA